MPGRDGGICPLSPHLCSLPAPVPPLQQRCPLPRQGCPAPSSPTLRSPNSSLALPGLPRRPLPLPVPQFPPCQGCSFPGFPSFPGKGRELPPPLPHIPAAEPGDCDELWVRGASAGFLAPAGRLGAIARLLPARPRSRPAVPLGRRRRHRSGHRAARLARPRRPQPSPAAGSRAGGDAGREERGQTCPVPQFPQPDDVSPGLSMVSATCPPPPPPSPARAHAGEEQDRGWVLLCQPPPHIPTALPGQGTPSVRAPVPPQPLPPVGRVLGSRSGTFLCPAAAGGMWGGRGHPKLWGACCSGTAGCGVGLGDNTEWRGGSVCPGGGLGGVGFRGGLAAVQAAGGCARCPVGLQIGWGSRAVPGERWCPPLCHPRGIWVFGSPACLARLGTALPPPQQRNRRGKAAGKVNCKNMKQDCPVPACPRATLLPGHCCHTCPKALPGPPEKSAEPPFDTFEYFQDKEDELDKPYNDRSYLSSEGLARDDARTEFVALLTSGPEPWHPTSSAVAKARFTLLRSYLLFSISYERLGRPSRVRFSDPEGNVLFEHPVQKSAAPEDGMVRGAGGHGGGGAKRPRFGPPPPWGHGPLLSPRVQAIQSVLCGADALLPTKTGAVGSAKLALHENGTLQYQVRVVGTASEVVGVTLETKPRRKNKRNVLFDMTPSYKDGLAQGSWQSPSARDAHMLLQNELFLNVATKDWAEGELRGQVISLPYSGLLARYTEMPVPLAGQLVSPPVGSGAGGHAWLSLDEHCHLHYEIAVAGLGRPADGTVSAHLHGVAELGELGARPHQHKRLLKGFYGTEAQGVVKDLDADLLQHLAQGTAFLQVSTKAHPRGEMRGRVHIPNRCQAGGARLAPGEAELSEGSKARDAEQLKKDPNSCFFEGQHRAHGTRWAPDYDKKCSVCSCQKRTVICDPILCQPLNCSRQVHPEELCCPVCEEKKTEQEELKLERARDSSEGCYFDGDKTWRGSGTRWHPVVPPFGLIKCAICTCKGTTGEVHCEKVQCPRLTCANPVRASPSDCCKQCPAPEKSIPELADSMQADGPRACRFGRRWYLNNESWHPSVPPFGEMKCILCWCVSGETHCQRQECPPAACASPARRDNPCCAKCRAPDTPPEKVPDAPAEAWSR
nr:chordin [Anser cygnoides]